MRKSLLSLIVLSLSATVSAQNLKVAVRNDEGENLSYAYLYVNKKAVAVTDSLGVGIVPAAKLSVGDTVSVSYVGTEPQQAVYDEAMRRQGVWEVILNEKYRTLTADEVTVRADIEALFRRSLKRIPITNYRHSVRSRFTVTDRPHTVQGTVIASHVPGDTTDTTHYSPTTKRGIYWYHTPMKITTADDTTGIGSRRLHNQLHLGFNYTAIAPNIVYRGNHYGNKAQYGYLGKRDNCRVFRVTHPKTSENGGKSYFSLQFLVWVGIEDQLIHRLETHTVNLDDESSWSRIDISYTTRKIKSFGSPRTLTFSRLEASYPNVEITLDDPEFTSYQPPKTARKKRR